MNSFDFPNRSSLPQGTILRSVPLTGQRYRSSVFPQSPVVNNGTGPVVRHRPRQDSQAPHSRYQAEGKAYPRKEAVRAEEAWI